MQTQYITTQQLLVKIWYLKKFFFFFPIKNVLHSVPKQYYAILNTYTKQKGHRKDKHISRSWVEVGVLCPEVRRPVQQVI